MNNNCDICDKMASDHKSSVIALNGKNYATWKIQCRMSLMKDGLWNIVSGQETQPTGVGVTAAEINKFTVRSDRALAIIVLSVEPTLLYLLGDPNDPGEVWERLAGMAAQFEKKSWANKLELRRKLYNLRLKEGSSVQNHIKSMTEIFNSLSVIGDNISDEDKVVHLLASLPDSFNMLVTALEANCEVPKMEIVTERLLNEETKRSERKTPISSEESVFLVKKKNWSEVSLL